VINMKQNVVLAAKIDYLTKYANRQFNENKGLKLNSKDWQSFIRVKNKDFYSFLRNGTIVFSTVSAISGKTYQQPIKLKNFKRVETLLFLLFLCKITDNQISDFIKVYLSNEDVRVRCTCQAFSKYGPHYNLTQIDSIYGPGENRPPVVRDKQFKNLVCKHLWLVLNDYTRHINMFSTSLIPYYKRYFGVQSPKGAERLKKQLGKKELIKLIEQAFKELKKLNINELDYMFKNLTKNTINELNSFVTSPIEKPEEQKTKEEQNIPVNEEKENFEEEDINEMLDNVGALSSKRNSKERKILGAKKNNDFHSNTR